MAATPQPQVTIIGAGPSGLTLACDLARRRVPFRLLEAAAESFRGSRAKGLQPRTLEVFEDLGLLDGVLAAGGSYPKFRLHVGPLSLPAGRLGKIVHPTPSVPYPNLWMLPQGRTNELLLARLAELGGRPEFGVAFEGFEQDPAGVTVTVATASGSERIRTDYLVGCDGGHSLVRKALGVRLVGESIEGAPVVMGDVEIEGLDRELWHVWPFAKGCLLTLCPMPGGGFFQLAAPLRKHSQSPELTEAGLRSFIERAVGPGKLRVGRVLWTGLYRSVHARMAEHFRGGRVLLAGDAAHVHPAAGGQGLNTGVQDAYNLGWKLAAALGGAPDSLLETYEAERLPIAASVLGLSKELFQKRSLKRGADTHQLALGYRDGPLADDRRAKPGGVRAGDRAPDAPLRQLTGRPRRLFEALQGPHWTLLAFERGHDDVLARARERWPAVRLVSILAPLNEADAEGLDATAAEALAEVLIDLQGHARASYGVRSEALVLVRPDGYIGHLAEPGRWEDLDAYLARVLGPPPAMAARSQLG